MEVLKYPNPVLKLTAKPVEVVDDHVRTLIDNMTDTMYSESGIGLAAIQVGVEQRVIILDVPDGKDYDEAKDEAHEKPSKISHKGLKSNLMQIVNPEIHDPKGETYFEEGCLSVPGYTAEVKRSDTLTLKGLDRDGKAIEKHCDGLLAVAVQHEIDHLDGILFIDHLSALKRGMIKRKLKKVARENAEAV